MTGGRIVIIIAIKTHILQGAEMKTVQMTLDEDLVAAVDRAARKLRTTRSSFTRMALREALKRMADKSLERRHRKGYQAYPVEKGEFDIWEKEQQWGDE